MQGYFTLETKNDALINLNGQKAKFVLRGAGLTNAINLLYSNIVSALKKRNFNVPNVDIEFNINSENEVTIFKLSAFNGDLEMVSDYKAMYKGLELSIYEDGGGSVHLYCGNDWENEKQEFMCDYVNRKLRNKSKMTLLYDYDFMYSNKHIFKATDDLGRAHYPDTTKGEPLEITLIKAENDILIGLKKLLKYVELFPEQKIDKDIFAEPFPLFLSNPLFNGTVLHTTIDRYGAQDIRHDNTKPITIGGARLLNFSTKPDQSHKYAKYMNDGFTYCNVVLPGQDIVSERREWDDNEDVVITLKNANNVFVIDDCFNDIKKQWFIDNPDVDRMTQEACDDALKAKANTMVHINDYDGSYKNPQVIINRKIMPNEMTLLQTTKQ